MNGAHQNAIGTGVYLGLYFLSLLYIFVKLKEEDKNKKVFLLVYPIIIFVFIWNPAFVKLMLNFIDHDVYWRMYWLFPLGITISYVFTEFVFLNSKGGKRLMTFAGIIFVIIISGKLIYSSEFFTKVNNPYKIPDNVFEIIEMVSKDNENYKKLIGPQEFIIYTRQYDATIKLGEPRDFSGVYDDSTMVKQIADGRISEMIEKAKIADCNYIVLYKGVEKDVEPEIYGFQVFGENDSYVVYKFE